ncbi:hypothetical protein Trydic_g10793 [Trypoxylus dichotomus]
MPFLLRRINLPNAFVLRSIVDLRFAIIGVEHLNVVAKDAVFDRILPRSELLRRSRRKKLASRSTRKIEKERIHALDRRYCLRS